MKDYGTFECLNCGRNQQQTQYNQKFCNPQCKDRYWSRGTRRVSKMNIKLNTLVDLCEELIEVVNSNQARIKKLEDRIK